MNNPSPRPNTVTAASTGREPKPVTPARFRAATSPVSPAANNAAPVKSSRAAPRGSSRGINRCASTHAAAATAASIAKLVRQENHWMSTPPRLGPTMDPAATKVLISPSALPRWFCGKMDTIRAMLVAWYMEAPSPCRMRKGISHPREGEKTQARAPSIKMQ
ncbi:hypothetical protein D3C76_1240140 [compost metagenome]